MKTYIYHNDPGHGWFAVPRSELVALGIANQISGFSYQKGKTVYLEEDGDAGTWFKAYEAKHGQPPKYDDRYSEGRNYQHRIRSYQSYDPKNPPMTASDFQPGDDVNIYGNGYTVVRMRSKTTCIVRSASGMDYVAKFSTMKKD